MQEVKEKKDAAPCKPEDYEFCGNFVSAFNIIGKNWNGLIIRVLCVIHKICALRTWHELSRLAATVS